MSLNSYNENIILTKALAEKADVDLSNISDTGEEVITNLASPSSGYTVLTLGSSGTAYTAPSDGWFTVYKTTGISSSSYLRLSNSSSGMICEVMGYGSTIDVPGITIAAKKGQSVTVSYSMTGSGGLRFTPLGN